MKVRKAPRVKYNLGIIYHPAFAIRPYLSILENVFGKQDLQSNVYAFDFTDYYEEEMGKQLLRVFISCEKLIRPENLPEIKLLTNVLEEKTKKDEGRVVNLDPGYLDMDKFILASAKYAPQKIYLDKGIYADPALYYYKRSFHPYDWSFPDFRSAAYNTFFSVVRENYKKQLRE
ncbi:MAG: DUF4416 family protein [Fidelibacterota bacterium]